MDTTISDEPAARPGDHWRQAVEERAIPQAILDLGTEPAQSLTPERFRWRPEHDALHPVRPSRRRALEALPEGGSVIDVGVGGGASSLGLAAKAGLITGVDRLEPMLEAFEESGRAEGVATRAVLGAWPDVAHDVEPADVVVCHNAIYGLMQIEEFVEALTAHARIRVVVEVAGNAPMSHLNPLWKAFHGITRPEHRVADDAESTFLAMGLPVEREDAVVPGRNTEVTPDTVAFVRKRLYVGPEHDPEIQEFLRNQAPQNRSVSALWWPGTA